jgi:polyhydroxybutyrate depolymerase
MRNSVKGSLAIFLALCLAISISPVTARDHKVKLRVGGVRRSYTVHVPKGYTGEKRPLVLVLHGILGNGWVAEINSRMSARADQDCFFAVYPNGKFTSWNAGNCCGPALAGKINDVEFAKTIIAEMKAKYAIDEDRIYVAGISNGGMMAYRLACELSDTIAAIAPIASCQVTPSCKPRAPVSVIAFNGTTDGIMRYKGGTGWWLAVPVKCPPVNETIKYWVESNQCQSEPMREEAKGLVKEIYAGGKHGTEVRLYTINAGHVWPGSPFALPFAKKAKNVSATDEICDFFLSHPKIRPAEVAHQ